MVTYLKISHYIEAFPLIENICFQQKHKRSFIILHFCPFLLLVIYSQYSKVTYLIIGVHRGSNYSYLIFYGNLSF